VLALTRAVLRGAIWAGAPENAGALATLLARKTYIGADDALIAARLGAGALANLRFARAALPSRRHAGWFLGQMVRWGQVEASADLARAMDAYRPDLFSVVAAQLGVAAPESAALEGAVEDPDAIRDYAASFAITRARG
jgi:hypothetical protein